MMKHAKVLMSCCVGLIALPFNVAASGWAVVPNAQLQGGYDDNVRLTTEVHEGVRSETFTPSVMLTRKTPSSSTAAEARLGFTRYSGDGVKNTNVQYLKLSSLYQGELALWRLRGTFKRDTTLKTITGGGDLLIDDAQDVDEGLVQALVRRNRLDLEPSWRRTLTERMSVELKYKIRDVDYSNAENTGLVDYQRQELGATLMQRVTEKSRLSVVARFSKYEAPGAGVETDENRLMLAIDHEFTQTIRGNASIGRRKSSSVAAGAQENETAGTVWRMGLSQRHSDLTSYRLSLERGLNSSGVGQVVKSDRINVRVIKKIAPLLSVNLGGYVFRNKALEGESTRADRRFYRIDLGMRRSFTRHWFVDVTYRYRWQKRDEEQSSADSNALYMGLSYTGI